MRNTQILLFILWFTLQLSSSFANTNEEREFVANEARAKVFSAQTRDEFKKAAEAYQGLIDEGVRNGEVFYNLGTSLIMAGEYKLAIPPLLRAERYMGSDWDIKRNMLIAMAGKKKDETITLPWYRVLLFWHYDISAPTRISIAVLAFAGFWLGLSLRIFKLRKLAAFITVVSLTVFILFGSSAVTSLIEEMKEHSVNYIKQPSIEHVGENADADKT